MADRDEQPPDGPSEALFRHNMARLAAIAPDFHRIVAGVGEIVGQVVQDPNDPGDINFIVKGQLFYNDGLGARAHARREVARYLAAPQRLYLAPLSEVQSPIRDLFRDRIDAALLARDLKTGGTAAPHRAATLVLFGIGLGEPLRLLLDALPCRHVVVVEPIAEFLWHSLWLQDWAGWHDLLAARGGSLRVVSGEDAEHLSTMACSHVNATGATVDGSYCYAHYQSAALTGAIKRFFGRMNSVLEEGFFEDELIMMTNSTRNFARRPVNLLVNSRPLRKTVPAIVCGAGPSLTKSLPHITALREGAVVFSAGTTLGSLLNHGIVPDFHCELENTEENYEALLPVAAAHDLSGMTLLAPATVDARIPPMFGASLLYVRGFTMSAALYGTDENTILATNPNCMTVAIRMVARFGFGEVYMFGTDFGSRRPDQHHVADSLWMSDPIWRERYDRLAEAMNMPMPGNFGGKVYTNRVLEAFLHATQRLIAMAPEASYYNCADGIRIEGAAPKLPSQVKFPILPDQRRAAIHEITTTAIPHAPGCLIDPARLRRFTRLYRDWSDGLLATLDGLSCPGHDLIDVHDAIRASFAGLVEDDTAIGVRQMTYGSLAMMFRQAFHHAIRNDLVADVAYKGVVLGAYAEVLSVMQQRLDDTVQAEFPVVIGPTGNAG